MHTLALSCVLLPCLGAPLLAVEGGKALPLPQPPGDSSKWGGSSTRAALERDQVPRDQAADGHSPSAPLAGAAPREAAEERTSATPGAQSTEHRIEPAPAER